MLIKIEDTEWFQKLMAYDHLLIFGATFCAQLTYHLMKACHAEPDCFIVSERRNNPFCLEPNLPKKLYTD